MINSIKNKIKNLNERENKTRYLMSYFIRNSFLRDIIGPINIGEFKIHFHDSALSQISWYRRNNRIKEINFIKKYLKKGDKYIDVGANIGITTIPGAMEVGNEGMVFAFEAHPRIYSFMEENIYLNNVKNVNKYNLAIGAKCEKIGFTDMRAKDDQNYMQDEGDIYVNKETLDVVCGDIDNVDLIKVDVEGAEMRVMLGAEDIIEKTNCAIMELIDENLNRYGDSALGLKKFMNNKGFNMFVLREGGVISSLSNVEGADYENVIAIKDVSSFVDRTGYVIN